MPVKLPERGHPNAIRETFKPVFPRGLNCIQLCLAVSSLAGQFECPFYPSQVQQFRDPSQINIATGDYSLHEGVITNRIFTAAA